MQITRGCGIIAHPTSLPGNEPVGTLGVQAIRFINLLQNTGVSWWQVLPLNPPSCCNSPYSAFSAFAGNPLLIDLETLVQEGDLSERSWPAGLPDRVDYEACDKYKDAALHSAAATFFAGGRSSRMDDFWHFCDTTAWLHDYALFMAFRKKYQGKPWWNWPKSAALIDTPHYEKASVECGEEIGVQKYIQWQFYRQWGKIKRYANSRGIDLIGDIPIFVARDSADVWRNRYMFLLDAAGKPKVVAGVPPDYFSKTGQLWGNPLYDWDVLRQNNYGWWQDRFRWMCAHFDIVRVDHFRGFEAAWHVPVAHKTAIHGRWEKGPGSHLFEVLFRELGELPLIAEDLGVITPEVEILRDQFGFPGMKILQFAFGSGSANPYLPHNHVKRCVVYSGTHDNDTTAGWYSSLDKASRQSVHDYLGDISSDPVREMLRVLLMSVADIAIVPLQDILRLDSLHRMNVPGDACGNWSWRMTEEMMESQFFDELHVFLDHYGRSQKKHT